MVKPSIKPSNPCFSVGPCAKFPGWSLDLLKEARLSRMHRSSPSLERILQIFDLTKEILEIPSDYLIGMVPGSATGAIEMVMWSCLGSRPVDVLVWDAFGERWQYDIQEQLKLENCRVLKSPTYGEIADLSQVNFDHDVVFNWNGSSSGVCVPDGNWIPAQRKGLVICDATSSAFAMKKPWDKLDITVFSWQKGLGSEAGHGMIVLSPRAVDHITHYTPPWPIPWIFGLKRQGAFHANLFHKGWTNNTPSLLCIEDYYQALLWAKGVGGLSELVHRSQENARCLGEWVARTPWIDFVAKDPTLRSHTTIALMIVDEVIQTLDESQRWDWLGKFCQDLAQEKAAYDIQNHSFAPPTLRIWGGPTVTKANMQALLPWLEWSFQKNRVDFEVTRARAHAHAHAS